MSIHDVSRNGNLDELRHLLGQGADTNEEKEELTPLMEAASAGHLEVTQFKMNSDGFAIS